MDGIWLALKEVIDSISTKKKSGRVTVPGYMNDDVHPKTLASIFKQAQLKRQLRDEVERYYYET